MLRNVRMTTILYEYICIVATFILLGNKEKNHIFQHFITTLDT